MMRRTLIILILLSAAAAVAAQQYNIAAQDAAGCQGRLREAGIAYQSGLFMKSVEILERSIDSCDLSRKEKEQALELLAKSYVEAGETGKAESIIDILIRKFPHYELREDRNPEMFNRMVKRYSVHPRLVIGVKNTAWWIRRKTMSVPTVLNTLDYSEPQRDSSFFFTYYGCAEYEFIKGLSINADISFLGWHMSRIISPDRTFFLSAYEYDRFVEFPIYLKKYFDVGKNFRFYVSAGYGPFINYYARADFDIIYTESAFPITGRNQYVDTSMHRVDMLPLNNRLTGQWNVGAGLGYSYRNLRFYADIRYLGGVGSYKAPEKSYLIPELKEVFFYVDQELKINQFEVGVTISYTLFNSVKRKNLK
jgi:hypothetical protein